MRLQGCPPTMHALNKPIVHTIGLTMSSSKPRTNWPCRSTPASQQATVMEQIMQLEDQATAAHLQAQELNKQGRFADAAAKYEEMRRLDAAALDLTQELGCASCRVDLQPPAGGAAADSQQCSSELYERLHTPQPWPAAAAAASDGLSMAERAVGCIMGCLTADAAATGVQWVYDLEALDKLLAQRRQAAPDEPDVGLEFFDPVASPFLPQYACSRNSPYGEQTLLLLQSLAEQRGLHCGSYAVLYSDAYSSASFDGYRNASTTQFLRNMRRGLRPPASGAEDQQADCVARLAPLLAAFAGDDRLMQLVEAATRVTQNTAAAVAWATAGAAVLERLLLQGCGVAQAVQETVADLRLRQQQQQQQQEASPVVADDADAAGRAEAQQQQQLAAEIADRLEQALLLRQQPHAAAVTQLGRNCHMPNSLQTPLHAALHQEWLLLSTRAGAGGAARLRQEQKQAVYVAAVRDALAAGGCCASRSSYAGALLGAWLGPGAVPHSWRGRYGAWDAAQGWADTIVGCRQG